MILCKPYPEAKISLPQPYTRSTMASGADNGQFNSYKLSWGAIAGIALFSVLYFADIFFKASRKCFWFDELFTVYLCRLPDFKSLLDGSRHGADFNPPILYLLKRGSQSALWRRLDRDQASGNDRCLGLLYLSFPVRL